MIIKKEKLFKNNISGIFVFLVAALVCCIFLTGNLQADSMFGAPHLGVPSAEGDARTRAMGGISAALPGEVFTVSNPARMINFWRAGFNGVISQDYRSLKGTEGDVNLRSTDFIGFRGIYPGYKKFVFSWGICRWKDLAWEYSDRETVQLFSGEIGRNYTSEGGLYLSRFAVARTLGKKFAFGFAIDWIFGNVKNSRLLDLSDQDLLDNQEVVEDSYTFIRPVFGVLTSIKDVNLGFSAALGGNGDLDRQVNIGYSVDNSFASNYSRLDKLELKFPVTWRLGFSRRVTQRALIGGDIEFEGWEKGGVKAIWPFETSNQWKYCLGFELLPSAEDDLPLYRKFPLRLGFSRTTYAYKISGSNVAENIFSIGTGSYFGNKNGKADIALEYLRRTTGASGYPEESVFRVVFSLAGFEKWTSRPRRK